MATTGLFGSTIGGKASQRPKPYLTPAGVPLKAPAEHLRAVPSFHTPAALHLSAKLTGIDMTGSSASAAGGSTMKFQGIPSKYTLSGSSTGGDSSLFGDLTKLAGGVEGFMSHLSSDIVHTTLGMPMGLIYLAEHPISGAEGVVKATWHDWSPLFHGDVRTWLHNTYEHPLAPILDVAGVLSFGAGTAARSAGALGKLADASRGIDAAAEAADTVANVSRVAGRHVSAVNAGRAAAESGFRVESWAGKLQKFASPAGFAARTYAKTAERLGYTTPAAQARFIAEAMQNDPVARRLFKSEAGVKVYKAVSDNPLIRLRQAKLRQLGNHLASKNDRIAHIVGDQAMYRRWATMDKGSRRAAVARLIQGQIAAFHTAGGVITRKGERWMAEQMHPSMRRGLVEHAHVVKPAGPLGSKALQDQLDQLGREGFQGIMADQHAGPLMAKALADLHKAGRPGLLKYFNKDWSHANVTNEAGKVLFDANGDLRVVSRTAQKLGGEGYASTRVVRLLYNNPTKVWKYLLLGASPRYFINNFVGNSLMLMAATDPVSLARAFVSHVRTVRGAKAADRLAEDTIRRTMPAAAAEEAIAARRVTRYIGGRHWMERWFGQEYGFGQSNRVDPKTGLPVEGFEAKAQKLTLNKVTHERADMPQRYMAMNYTMKRIPEYQQEYARLRSTGVGHFDAEVKASEHAAENPAVRQLIRAQVNHMFGQYHTFAGWETHVKMVVPFYAWDRAIVTHMAHLVRNEPYKLAMGAAIGTLGNVRTQEILGQVPDFMLGAIPAKVMSGPLGLLGKSHGGRQTLFNTYGLNPYATVGDITQLATSALPGNPGNLRAGESLGAQLNPIIQGAAAQIGGVNLQSGTPAPQSKFGPVAGMYAQAFEGLPQWQILMGLLGKEGPSVTKKGNPTLYEKNLESSLTSFLGAPVRRADMNTAAAMARLQGGKKKQPYKFPKHIPGM